MALATIADLAAIGAIAENEPPQSARATRAGRLLEMASAQVVAYLKAADEAELTTGDDALPAHKLVVLATIVAEIAASRLTTPGAQGIDPYEGGSGFLSSLIQRRHMRALDKLIGRAGQGSTSITVDRDEESSFLNWSNAGYPNDVSAFGVGTGEAEA